MDSHIDDTLRAGLDPAAATALAETAAATGRHYTYDRWLVNGRSRATVAIVWETDNRSQSTRKLLLKVPTVTDGAVDRLEYSRHLRVMDNAPKDALKHLTEMAHEPIRVGDGSWIMFQRIAGKTFEHTEVLTVLLQGMLRRGGPEHVACDADTFADACGRIVTGVLRDWAVHPYVPPGRQPLTVAEFLRLHLADQLEPGGRLHPHAERHQADQIQLDGEPGLLPNPFAVARGRWFPSTGMVHPLLGRAHGDLHTDNALIRVYPKLDVDDYFLIDTPLYEDLGPLTRDPVHFVLYVIARSMETLSREQQSALIDLLLDQHGPHHQLVPGWLATVVRAVADAGTTWVEGSGLAREWRAQTLLSTVACALMYIGRTSTREIDKPWFLRLAARAADRFDQERQADGP